MSGIRAFKSACKKTAIVAGAAVMGLSVAFSAAAENLPAHHIPTDKSIQSQLKRADSTLIIDVTTGKTLHEDAADELRYPASLTKIMVLYMAFEAIEAGLMNENDMMMVSAHAASMPRVNLNLKAGDKISVKDAILSLITHSANDAAVVLGEHVAGAYGKPKNERVFARMMTEKAQALGMSKTIFINTSGLHDARQVTTARDMATLAAAFIDKFEDPNRNDDPYDLFKTTSFTFNGRTYKNHNNLLKTVTGAEGMKTGYIYASGFNLVAVINKDGKRYIGIIFGGESGRKRDNELKKLFEQSIPKAPQPI